VVSVEVELEGVEVEGEVVEVPAALPLTEPLCEAAAPAAPAG
jgi:hypothetical protein